MLVQRAVGVENVDGFQVVFLTQIVVVDVVRRVTFKTRSEFAVHVLVEDDRHLPIGHGHPGAFAVEVGKALVFGWMQIAVSPMMVSGRVVAMVRYSPGASTTSYRT